MRILQYPQDSKLLRTPGRLVSLEEVNSLEFQSKLAELKELLKKDGMGLAATQCGWSVKLFLLSQDENLKNLPEPLICLNPQINSVSKSVIQDTEGCLSFRDLFLEFKRPESITWQYTDLEGNLHVQRSQGYYARAVLHEIDHLDGRLFIDNLPSNRQLKVKQWLRLQK